MSAAHLWTAVALAALSGAAWAVVTPDALLRDYEIQARATEPAFSASAGRGATLFRATHGREWSCATCHGTDPSATGRHARTGNAIRPLAPAANAQRFTDTAKVEKWFGRNCGDVVGRPCTVQEKADLLAFLRSIR